MQVELAKMVIFTAALFVLIFNVHRINPINPGSLEGWIFQQDGAPPHTTKKVRDLLNEKFGSNYFAGGKRGAKLGLGWDFPSSSCDLTVMDFFANPYLKEKIWYDPLPRNIAELNVRIVACIKGIPEEFLINACYGGVDHRVDKCLEEDGYVFYNG